MSAVQRAICLSAPVRRCCNTSRLGFVRLSPSSVSRRYSLPSSSSSSRSPQPPSPPSSINPTEISHFDALASSWWDPHGSSRLLHLMNPLRHDFIRRCIPTSPHSQDLQLRRRKLRYLDVGCGGGIFAESAARLHDTASVTAIDPSPVVLAIAKAHSKNDPLLREQGRLTYENVSIEGLNIPTTEAEQYDILSLFEVIEHISHPAPFLQSCLPFVKPGGWIVMSTIARSWTSWLTTKIVAEDVVGLVPKGTHDWNKYINPEELRGFFEGQREWGNGTNGMKVMGVVYVPGFGWREVQGSEGLGNYFFAVQKGQIEATTR